MHNVDGSSSTGTALLLENYAQFLSFLSKRLSDKTLAEDLLQQSLLKAMKSPPDSAEEKSVLSWFYRILRNSLTDHYRSQSAAESAKEAYLIQNQDKVAVHTDELKSAICQCFYGIIPALNKDYGELIRRIDLQQEDQSIVAADMHLSRGAFDVKLSRARKAFKKALEGLCGACTEHACLDCSCKKPSQIISHISILPREK